MAPTNRLLRALPMRGLRAHVGTKSGPRGGATALVDLEPAAAFETVYAVPDEFLIRRDMHDDPELTAMCFDNIVIGIENELREHFRQELPALRAVIHEVLPHPVEANEMNNQSVGKRIVREAFRRLAVPHKLVTDEVDLAYDVHGPLPTEDGRPPLLLIGQPMHARGFLTLACHFLDRTVVTYDPRGFGRSVRRDGRVDHRPHVHAEDVHALIQALGAGPVEMFASDGGAVTALALVAVHPESVTTLVAHEPPLLPVLPDAAAAARARAAVRDMYEANGYHPGEAAFRILTSWQGEFTDDYFAGPGPDLAQIRTWARDGGKRDDPTLSALSWAVGDHHPDIQALTAAPTRVVIAASEETRDTMTGRAAIAVAELLGQKTTIFPNQPDDLLGHYWYEREGQPAAFAEKLRAVLG